MNINDQARLKEDMIESALPEEEEVIELQQPPANVGAESYSEPDPYDQLDLGFDDDAAGFQAPMERHAELLKGLTDFNSFIKDKINGYLGLVWSETKGMYVRDKDIMPILNKRGAAWLVDNMKTYTRGNNIITYIRKDQYINLVDNIIDVLWFGFAPRAKKVFGVTSSGDLMRICSELQDTAELVLMGSGDGKTLNFLEGTTRHMYTDQGQQPNSFGGQQGQGKMSFLSRLKKVVIG